jgi:hypothetical protein
MYSWPNLLKLVESSHLATKHQALPAASQLFSAAHAYNGLFRSDEKNPIRKMSKKTQRAVLAVSLNFLKTTCRW